MNLTEMSGAEFVSGSITFEWGELDLMHRSNELIEKVTNFTSFSTLMVPGNLNIPSFCTEGEGGCETPLFS